jgi:hypothetical protein
LSDSIVINKEMGITHQEFFRNIPRVLGDADYVKSDSGIVLQDGEKHLEIAVSAEGERRIALFVLPVTHVTLTFMGYSEDAITTIIEKFDRAFQRGGG